MAEAAPAADVPRESRLDRRKARTRQALIDAAVRLIGEGRGDRASIAEITEEADIGLGSFYNHFDSKEQLFQTASEEVLERWGQLIDRATAGITDPAELFAVGTRISRRLGWTHPDIAGFLTGAGLDVLDIPTGLAPRALRDIRAGQAAGRFTVPDAEIALSAAAGGLLGLLRTCQRHPNASRRPPLTSSPRPSCACSASPSPKPPASPPSRSLALIPGNGREEAAGRPSVLPLPRIDTW
jgi:AcrR family transcriptional regulator